MYLPAAATLKLFSSFRERIDALAAASPSLAKTSCFLPASMPDLVTRAISLTCAAIAGFIVSKASDSPWGALLLR